MLIYEGNTVDELAEAVTGSYFPMSVHSHSPALAAKVDQRALGDESTLSLARIDAHQTRRTAEHVRQGDGEDVAVVLPLAGIARLGQSSRAAMVPAGSGAMYVSWRPYVLDFHGRADMLMVHVRRRALGLRHQTVEFASVRTFSPLDASFRMFEAYARTAYQDAENLTPQAARVADRVLCELLAATFVRSDESHGHRSKEAFLVAVDQTVGELATDPELTVAELAARLGVSVRYLQRVTQERGYSPREQITEGRLRHAERLLDRPLQGRRARLVDVWSLSGFSDESTFVRAFRRKWSMTPRQWTEARQTESSPPGSFSAAEVRLAP